LGKASLSLIAARGKEAKSCRSTWLSGVESSNAAAISCCGGGCLEGEKYVGRENQFIIKKDSLVS